MKLSQKYYRENPNESDYKYQLIRGRRSDEKRPAKERQTTAGNYTSHPSLSPCEHPKKFS